MTYTCYDVKTGDPIIMATSKKPYALKKTVYRNALSGRFVTQQTAKRNPKTTVKEVVPVIPIPDRERKKK
jgi:hypothetical protein